MAQDLQSELVQTQKKLEALEAEYQEFVSILTHDLNAPLRQIEGFAEILVSKHADSFDDKSKRHFSFITQGATTAQNIVEALKKLSKIKPQAESQVVVDCNDVIDSVKNQLSMLIEQSQATITTADLPTVCADRDQLEQLFYHLLHNALLYQKAGNPALISVEIQEQQQHWQFRITDNGIGIAPELTEKVCKVLRRAVKDKDYPGMGMGLAIAKKIITFHGGDIMIEPSEEQGTSIIFTLSKKEMT